MQGPFWKYFYTISAIPRESGNEKHIREYIHSLAISWGLETRIDAVGNILVSREGSPGREQDEPVAIQGHLDMVCEKNADAVHDFSKDPLVLEASDGWLSAKETTLGADNGIAVAMALALLEDRTLSHPPLEAVFTVDEETGLTGAMGLAPGYILSRRLINLDSEEEGFFYIGCAGGIHTLGALSLNRGPSVPGVEGVVVGVRGLKGGHSGMEIHKDLGNAVVLGAGILSSWSSDIYITDMRGGEKHNAIPREWQCSLCVHDRQAFLRHVLSEERKLRLRFPDEPGLSVFARESDVTQSPFGSADSRRLVDLLVAVPHGPVTMDPNIPGLVESSTNLAAVRTEESVVKILTSQRSSDPVRIDEIVARVKNAILEAGGTVDHESAYPGWKPDTKSPLLALAKSVYRAYTGKEPVVTAVHAGLECGVIGEKFPGIDMLSFGPDILGAHSPDERINIASADRVWGFLLALLEAL